MRFLNRADAGRQLASKLRAYARERYVRVLGVARGGVPVAFEVARALRAPLDVLLVRKLGVPGHPEVAFGAIAAGVCVLDRAYTDALQLTLAEIEAVRLEEQRELERRERMYCAALPPEELRGWSVVLVDDGLATGCSLRAAVASLRPREPVRIVVAVPVGARETCAELRSETDDVVCAYTPEFFASVGSWYEDFSQTGDDEVCALLARAKREWGSSPKTVELAEETQG